MAAPQRHLRVVDEDSGEVFDRCPGCADYEDQVKGLEKDLRAWRTRFAELARDKDRDARVSEHWPAFNEAFAYWRKACNHPRCKVSADRFFLVEPYLREDGIDLVKRAIDGAAYDPFTTTRRNGTKKRHDGWELIFRDRGKFEEFCNRAPR